MMYKQVFVLALAVAGPLGAVCVPALADAQHKEQLVGNAQDEAAIRALFDKQDQAWKRRDGEGFAAQFSEDADFINITGKALRGRDEIARHHNGLFTTVYRDASVKVGEMRIRFIRSDVATIEAESTLTRSGQPDRHAHFLAVATRQDDRWQIRAFHNMIPFVPPLPR